MSPAAVAPGARSIIQPVTLLTVQVVRHEAIAPDVVTLFLAKPGTREAPGSFLPGQFITLAFQGRDGAVYRSYSLCGISDPHAPWEITAKRMPGGIVSNYLHDQVTVGTILQVREPRGTFVLPRQLQPDQSFVFVAVGSGITTIRGFLRAIAALPAAQRPRVQLHYASRSPEAIIYRNELARLDPEQRWLRQWHYLGTRGPRMMPEAIFANARPLARQTQWYMCGPESLSVQMRAALEQVNVPAGYVHTEIFSDQSRKRPASATGTAKTRVIVQETAATLDVREHETLLEALERQGYQPEFSCRSGNCGTCQLHVLRGQVRNPGTNVLTASERRAGMVLSCVAQPVGDLTIESGGRTPKGAPIVVHNAAAAERTSAKQSLRMASVVGMGVLLTGLWGLTNHKPVNAHATLIVPTSQGNGSDQNTGSGTDSGGFSVPPPSVKTSSS